MALFRSQLTLANSSRIVYKLTLGSGQEYASLFKPETWAHLAAELPQGTIIEVSPEDGSWWAELLVRASSKLEVIVGELRRVTFDEIKPRDESEYEIVFAGPKAKHRVIRKADKAVMVEGLMKAQAEAWVKSPPTEQLAA